MAREMFEGAGDDCFDAVLTTPGGAPVYNPTKGRMEAPPRTSDVKVLVSGSKTKLDNPDLWMKGDTVVMCGTYDLDFAIPTGAKIQWLDVRIAKTLDYEVVQVSSEDGALGAFNYLHLRRPGNG